MNLVKKLIGLLLVVAIVNSGKAQTGVSDDFNDNILTGWTEAGSVYVLTETNQELEVGVTIGNNAYSIFEFSFSSIDMSSDPYIKVKIKTASTI